MSYSFGGYGLLNSGSGTAGVLAGRGINAADFYNEDALESRYDYQDSKEGHEIEYAGRDAAIETNIANVINYISSGREDEALEAYQDLLDEMMSQTRYAYLVGEDGNDVQLRAVAKQLIESELEDGQKLEDFINDNTVTASGRSWQKTFFNNSKIDEATSEDLLNLMCNQKEEKHVSAGQYVLEVICTPVKLFTELGDFLFGPKNH